MPARKKARKIKETVNSIESELKMVDAAAEHRNLRKTRSTAVKSNPEDEDIVSSSSEEEEQNDNDFNSSSSEEDSADEHEKLADDAVVKPEIVSKPVNAAKKSKASGDFYEIIRSSGSSFKVAIDNWISDFKTDPRSIYKLLNLVLKTSGSEIEMSAQEMEDSYVDKLTRIQDEMIKSSNVSAHPMQGKGKEAKKLKKNFMDFWKSFIREISSDILYSTSVLEDILVWLISLTSSKVRALRHTSTVCCLSMLTGLCKTGRLLQDRLLRESKESSKTALNEKIDALEDGITKIFDSVFVNRYLDIDSAIRVDCVAELSGWIESYPEMFLVNTVLRYFGYLISDKSHDVRHTAMKSIVTLCRKKERVQSMMMFLDRFKKRIIEIASLDVNDHVRISAIDLIAIIIDQNIFDSDSVEELSHLIFDDHNKIRDSVSSVLTSILENGPIKDLTRSYESESLKPKLSVNEIHKLATLKSLTSFVVENDSAWIHSRVFFEAMSKHYSLLMDFDFIFGQLLCRDLSKHGETFSFSDSDEKALLSFCEHILVTLRGNSDSKEYFEASRLIVDSMSPLLDHTKLDSEKLDLVLKLFLEIDINVFGDSRLRGLFESVWDELVQLFNMSISESVLSSVSKCMSFMHCYEDFSKLSHIKVTQLCEELIESFDGSYNEDGRMELFEDNTFYIIRRMKIISKHFDFVTLDTQRKLLGAIEYIGIGGEETGSGNDKIGCSCVYILFHDILWKLLKFKKKENTMDELKCCRDDLLDECVKILAGKNEKMKVSAFCVLSELFVLFSEQSYVELGLDLDAKNDFIVSRYAVVENDVCDALTHISEIQLTKPFSSNPEDKLAQSSQVLTAAELVVATNRMVAFSSMSYKLHASILPFFGRFDSVVDELLKRCIQECALNCDSENLLSAIFISALTKTFDNSVGYVHQAMNPLNLSKAIYQALKNKVFVSDGMTQLVKDGIFHALQHIVSFSGAKNLKERNYYIKFFKIIGVFVPLLTPRESSLLIKHLESELRKYNVRILDAKDWEPLLSLQKLLNKHSISTAAGTAGGKRTPSRSNTPLPGTPTRVATLPSADDKGGDLIFDINPEKENLGRGGRRSSLKRTSEKTEDEDSSRIDLGLKTKNTKNGGHIDDEHHNDDGDNEDEDEVMSFKSSPLIDHMKSSSPEKAITRKKAKIV